MNAEYQHHADEFDFALILNGDNPSHPGASLLGWTPTRRNLELIRLGCAVPQSFSGYVVQLSGTRSVRLDAARQLTRCGVHWNVDVAAITE